MGSKQRNQGRYVTIKTTVWGRLSRMGLSRLARLIMAELLHGDLRTNVKSGIFWPCHPMIISAFMNEPLDEVEAAMQELEEAGCIRMDTSLMLVWVREKWLHEWINNQSYVTAIVNEIEPMPPNSPVWLDVLGVFRALRDIAAEDEAISSRAAWFDPIIDIVKSKISQEEMDIEAIEEGHMWMTQVSNTSVQHKCPTQVPNTNGYRAIELPAKELCTKGLTAKDIKDIGRFLQSACVTKTFESFLTQYKKATGKEHPGISPSEKENVLERLERIYANFAEVTDAKPKIAMQITIKQFFDDWKTGDLKAEDPTIWLFLTPEVWRMRAFRAGVVDAESVFNRADGSVLGEEG